MASKIENFNQNEFDSNKELFYEEQNENSSLSTDEQLDVLAAILADLLLKDIIQDHDK